MKIAAPKAKKKETKYTGHPIPVRLEDKQEKWVRDTAKRMSVPCSIVLRTALDAVMPKIISGEINPFAEKKIA